LRFLLQQQQQSRRDWTESKERRRTNTIKFALPNDQLSHPPSLDKDNMPGSEIRTLLWDFRSDILRSVQ